jgi:hypothetical protein
MEFENPICERKFRATFNDVIFENETVKTYFKTDGATNHEKYIYFFCKNKMRKERKKCK